jgi:hypothetical protein
MISLQRKTRPRVACREGDLTMSARIATGRRPNPCSMRRPWRSAGIGIGLALTLCWTTGAAGQGKDDLWEVTTKMEMPGMPMAMPAQTQRVCIGKGGKDEDYVPKRENCRMLESKRVGNKVSYKMACTGKDAMSITGESTHGTNSYEGRMMMTGTMQGQPMEMSQTYAGKRIGDCTAPAK